jgi:quinol monooxygenase YgiN
MLQLLTRTVATVLLGAGVLLPALLTGNAAAQTGPFYISAVDLQISPSSMTKFLAALQTDGAGTIKEAGVHEFEAAIAQTDKNHVFILEVYNNAAAWDAHQKTSTYNKFVMTTMLMLKNYNIRPFTSVAMNRNAAAQPQTDPLFINLVELDIVPAQFDAFMAAAKANAAASMQDAGCREFDIAVSKKEPHHVMFFEVYDNEAALAAHQATDHFKTYDAATKTMVSKRVTTPLSSAVVQTK